MAYVYTPTEADKIGILLAEILNTLGQSVAVPIALQTALGVTNATAGTLAGTVSTLSGNVTSQNTANATAFQRTDDIAAIACLALALAGQLYQGIKANGWVYLNLPVTAPPDADIPIAGMAMWNNAGTLTFRIKDGSGGLTTKTL